MKIIKNLNCACSASLWMGDSSTEQQQSSTSTSTSSTMKPTNGTENGSSVKTPFLIGVAGGTASGKVTIYVVRLVVLFTFCSGRCDKSVLEKVDLVCGENIFGPPNQYKLCLVEIGCCFCCDRTGIVLLFLFHSRRSANGSWNSWARLTWTTRSDK